MPSFKLRDAETGELIEPVPASTTLPQAEAFRPGSVPPNDTAPIEPSPTPPMPADSIRGVSPEPPRPPASIPRPAAQPPDDDALATYVSLALLGVFLLAALAVALYPFARDHLNLTSAAAAPSRALQARLSGSPNSPQSSADARPVLVFRRINKPLPSIHLGDRILADDPTNQSAMIDQDEPDPSDLLAITLRIARPDGTPVRVQLLRNPDWLAAQILLTEEILDALDDDPPPLLDRENSARRGWAEGPPSLLDSLDPEINTDDPHTTHFFDPLDPVAPPLLLARADDPAAHQEPLFYLFLDLPSFGVLGWAAVTDVDPHPRIRPVPSPQTRPAARLVTGRFESIARELLDVTIVTDRGETEVIEATPSHPFYSADRRDYIPAAQLRLDERLRTADDPPGHASARVKSLVPRAPPQGEPGFRVYNLEVHGLHTYHVGNAGVLVHNECSTIGPNSRKGAAAQANVGAWLKQRGFSIVKGEVLARSRLGTRRYDFVMQDSLGKLWAIEVKSGNAVRTAGQRAKDSFTTRFGATLFGKNATDAQIAGRQIKNVILITVP